MSDSIGLAMLNTLGKAFLANVLMLPKMSSESIIISKSRFSLIDNLVPLSFSTWLMQSFIVFLPTNYVISRYLNRLLFIASCAAFLEVPLFMKFFIVVFISVS